MCVSNKNYSLGIVCLLGIFWTMGSCTKPQTSGIPIIATSIVPIADIAQNIAGDSLKIICTVPPYANPHTFEADPSTAKLLKSAEAFIGVHPEFDGWAGNMISPQKKKLFLSDIIKGTNPHVWLSVKNATLIAASMRDFFATLYPDKATHFSKNYTAYSGKLSQLDRAIAGMLSGVKQKRFFQWHPSWDYFASDYGIEIAGTIESGHGDSPSLKEFQNLKTRALKEGIKVVVVSFYTRSKTAEAFIREIGGREVRLDGIGDPQIPERANYLSLMEYNTKTLAKALSE